MIPLDINNLMHKKDIAILDKGIADATDELEKLYAVFAKAEFLKEGGVDFLPDRKQAYELYEIIYQNEKATIELNLLAQLGQASCLLLGSNNFFVEAKRAYDIFNSMDIDQVRIEIRQKAIYGKAHCFIRGDNNFTVNTDEAMRLLESLDNDKAPLELIIKVIILKIRCILSQFKGSIIPQAVQSRLGILVGRLDLNNNLISIRLRQTALNNIATCNLALPKFELAFAQFDKLDNDLTLMSIRQLAILGKAKILFRGLDTVKAFALFESLDNDQTDDGTRWQSVLFMAKELASGFFVPPNRPKALVYFKRLLTLASLPQHIQTTCNKYIPLLERDIQKIEHEKAVKYIKKLRDERNIDELDKIILTDKNTEIKLSAVIAKAECLMRGGHNSSPDYMRAFELFETLDTDATPTNIRQLSIIGAAQCLHWGRSHFSQGTERALQGYDRLLKMNDLPSSLRENCINEKMLVLESQNRDLKRLLDEYQKANVAQQRHVQLPPIAQIIPAAKPQAISTVNKSVITTSNPVKPNTNNSSVVRTVVTPSPKNSPPVPPAPVRNSPAKKYTTVSMAVANPNKPSALPTAKESGVKRNGHELASSPNLQGITTVQSKSIYTDATKAPKLLTFPSSRNGDNRDQNVVDEDKSSSLDSTNSSIFIPG